MADSDGKSSPERRRRWRRVLLLGCAAGVIGVTAQLSPSFKAGDVQGTLTSIRTYHAAVAPFGPLVFYVAGTAVIVANIPTIAVIACAALLYGRLGAALMGMACLLSASVIIYALSRSLGRSLVEPHLKRFLPILERHFQQRGLRTVALARLTFFALPPTNWALAVMNIRLRDYLAGTFIGAIPHVLMWAWIGVAAVEMLSGQTPFSWRAPEVWAPLVAGTGLTLLTVLIQRRAARAAA